ncbi:FAD-dependent oxidoreductase [Nonomuraea sp. NPDC049152]|uniref:NAD(P)/FAD-dependent oxidoreductase n=1 Tax=Nonomuraea sp. NPDC049152 TaxID=3154350 RepID=UPI0033F71310
MAVTRERSRPTVCGCAPTSTSLSAVNPRPEFVERIRLHQFVARTGDATIDYGTLLGEGIQLVVDSATRIDTAARTVQLASGTALDYDYVIYAVGSTAATPSSVPGAVEFALPIAEFESAQRLRARLDELPLDAPVTVVGGGLTGIETAAELAEQGRTVTLVCGRTLAPYLSAPGRRYVAKWLTRHGVAVLEAGVVTEVRPDAVVLADGSADGAVRPSALTIWTAGFGVPELAAASFLRHSQPRQTSRGGGSAADQPVVGVGKPQRSTSQSRMSVTSGSAPATRGHKGLAGSQPAMDRYRRRPVAPHKTLNSRHPVAIAERVPPMCVR